MALNAAISIGEAWMAPLAEIKGYQSPSEVGTRKETLGLVMVGKSGEPAQYMAMIERDGENVFLGETFVTRGQPVWEFAPFYQAWGRPIPEPWTAGFHDAVTDCAPNKVPPQGAHTEQGPSSSTPSAEGLNTLFAMFDG